MNLIRAIFLSFLSPLLFAGTVHYDLVIEHKSANISGKEMVDFAISVNGTIPAPTLKFKEGDIAEIRVINKLKEEASVHWHGILLPNAMDGVSYITTPPILPGTEYTFKFPIRQSGTYWYHSHTHLQEQRGVYGAIVIQPQKQRISATHDVVALVSDWIDEDPSSVLRNLKKSGDYYLFKKGNVPSYFGAIQNGGLGSLLSSEWTRMGAMDLSDIGYDAFLINGKKEFELSRAKAGDTVRLRIINAGSSSYFYVSLGKQAFQVVATDGKEVKPVLAKEILMGMGETYDLLFKLPESKRYELRATAQDVTGKASGWIGTGETEPAPDKPTPDLYMNHAGHAGHTGHAGHEGHQPVASTPTEQDHGNHSEHAGHDHSGHAEHSVHAETAVDTLNYSNLEALEPTEFPANAKRVQFKFELDGDMDRYEWYLNGKRIEEERIVEVKKDDVVQFVLVNQSMMHHPMHLHGHFFRLLNGKGGNSPWKHTVDMAPFATQTVEFRATEPGQWLFHCHNLYHMMTGMARVVKYQGFEPDPSLSHNHTGEANHEHDDWFFYGNLEAATNNAQSYLRISNSQYQLDLRDEIKKYNVDSIEADLLARLWLSKYLNVFAGGTYFEKDTRAVVGARYMLPFLIEASVFLDHKLKPRLDIERKFQWTKNLYSLADLRWRERDLSWGASLYWAFNWTFSVGARVGDEGIGAGARLQF